MNVLDQTEEWVVEVKRNSAALAVLRLSKTAIPVSAYDLTLTRPRIHIEAYFDSFNVLT